jgi:hypothetical protein
MKNPGRRPEGPPLVGRAPPRLDLCRGCGQFVWPDTRICPHCQGDVRSLAAAYEKDLDVARRAQAKVLRLLKELSFQDG